MGVLEQLTSETQASKAHRFEQIIGGSAALEVKPFERLFVGKDRSHCAESGSIRTGQPRDALP